MRHSRKRLGVTHQPVALTIIAARWGNGACLRARRSRRHFHASDRRRPDRRDGGFRRRPCRFVCQRPDHLVAFCPAFQKRSQRFATGVAESDLPLDINATLRAHALAWRDLGSTVQRLLLWDAGYVVTYNQSQLVRVYVACGRTMDEIVIARDKFQARKCPSRLCGDALQSAGTCLDIRVNCATTDLESHGPSQVVQWSEEQPNADMPHPTIFRIRNQSASIYMLDAGITNAKSGSCPPSLRLVIPCTSIHSNDTAEWCVPTPSGDVSPLLDTLRLTTTTNNNNNTRSTTTNTTSSATVVMPLLWVCVMSVAAVAGIMFVWSRRKMEALKRTIDDTSNAKPLQAPVTTNESERAFVSVHTTNTNSNVPIDKTTHRSLVSLSSVTRSSSSSLLADQLNASQVFLAFQRDPLVLAKRIPMDAIAFSRRMCQGASGDVFIGRVYGQRVAIKQLLQLRRTELDDLEGFACEIQLTATLDHPNIIRMVGVAWTTFQQLALVLEYRSGGDLLNAIRKRGARWSWNAEKLLVARGVAKAMVYLHGRGPHPLVHCDIKSRNILMDAATLEPALCDFGSSRTVSALGVLSTDSSAGTILWSAPEVICAQQYSVKADIFSFGVVLAELDTCTLPYTDSENRPIRAIRIAHMVVENQIKPQLSLHCPRFIRELVMQCVQHEPDERPTAEQVLARLTDAANDCAALWTSKTVGIDSL